MDRCTGCCDITEILLKTALTLSLLLTTLEAFVNSVDQDQTAMIYTVHNSILHFNPFLDTPF